MGLSEDFEYTGFPESSRATEGAYFPLFENKASLYLKTIQKPPCGKSFIRPWFLSPRSILRQWFLSPFLNMRPICRPKYQYHPIDKVLRQLRTEWDFIPKEWQDLANRYRWEPRENKSECMMGMPD